MASASMLFKFTTRNGAIVERGGTLVLADVDVIVDLMILQMKQYVTLSTAIFFSILKHT